MWKCCICWFRCRGDGVYDGLDVGGDGVYVGLDVGEMVYMMV